MSKNTNYLKNSPVDSLSPHGRGLTAAQFVVDNYAHRIDESATMNMWIRASEEVLKLAKEGLYFVTPLEAISTKETGSQK